MRPGVVEVEHQAIADAPFQLCLQCVIVRKALRREAADGLVLGIWTRTGVSRPQFTCRNLIEIGIEDEIMCVASHISNLNHHVSSKLALDCQIPGGENRQW